MSETQDNNAQVLRRTLAALRDMRSRVEDAERKWHEPIAIVGMGCRFPGGANSPEAYWQVLRDGIDTIRETPAGRWDVDSYFDPDPNATGKTYARAAGYLDAVDEFDPQFFGISPREAASMDPQHRLLMEVVWEALERAVIAPDSLAGSRSGVFVGVTTNDYLQIGFEDLQGADAYRMTGGMTNFAAGRIAYTLGLHGPCMAIDAACASSLVSVHLACQSLRAGECDLAIAGGVNLIAAPQYQVLISKTKALSPDGRCKTFDASADGMGRGEGCGVVILKRASRAERDGDTVQALILGSAVNQDGRGSGLTVPNPRAQEAVIREALTNACAAASEVSYVEAHGTGTPLGDPIEMQSIAATYGEAREPGQRLIVGCAKTNLGHLESAAGIAGLIKAVLSLQHRQIPPHLHFRNPNPHIPWDRLAVTIPESLTEWKSEGRRLAGLSSFGMSGTIAHLVLAETPQQSPPERSGAEDGSLCFLTLSARTDEALRALARLYAKHIESHPGIRLADLCFSANTGRAQMEFRAVLDARSMPELHQKLAMLLNGEWKITAAATSNEPPDISAENLTERFLSGNRIDWARFYQGQSLNRIALPTYPFQRRRYWLPRSNGKPAPASVLPAESSAHPLLGARLRSPAIHDIVFESVWSGSDMSLTGEHRIYDRAVVSASTYMELALAGAKESMGAGFAALADVVIQEPMVLQPRQQKRVQLVLREGPPAAFEIFSAEVEGEPRWTLHAKGTVGEISTGSGPETLSTSSSEPVDLENFYAELEGYGLHYGPEFRRIEALQRGRNFAEAVIDAAPRSLKDAAFVVHPGMLDSCFRIVGAAAYELLQSRASAFVMLGLDGFTIHRRPAGWLRCVVRVTSEPNDAVLTAHLTVVDASGFLVAEAAGMCFKPVSSLRESQNDWYYSVSWIPQPASHSPVDSLKDSWLIVTHFEADAAPLAEQLRKRGIENRVLLSTDAVADIEGPANVVYLGALKADSVAEAAHRTGAGLLRWSQICAKAAVGNAVRLWVATRNASSDPHQSVLAGMVRTLALEHPELRPALVEFSQFEDLAAEVLSESGEDLIAYLGGVRHVARLERQTLRDRNELPSVAIRPDAAYLVTGAFGGIGRNVVRWLTARGARHLVLMGRNAHAPENDAFVAELESAGARVARISGDIADRSTVARSLAGITAPLRGVVHAAGMIDDGALLEQNASRLQAVLRPKVDGAWNLHEETRSLPLDFFLLFSSGASVVGSAGQSNYAAANAFLDGLAHYRRNLGLPALSINWGPWSDTGMSARLSSASHHLLRSRGISGITPVQGLQALEELLRYDGAQLAVLPVAWPLFLRQLPEGTRSPFYSRVSAPVESDRRSTTDAGETPPSLQQLLRGVPVEKCRGIVLESVRERALAILAFDAPLASFDDKRPLSEYGLDSLMAVELRNALATLAGQSLSAGLLYLYPSVDRLADFLLGQAKIVDSDTSQSESEESRGNLRDEIGMFSEDAFDEQALELAERVLAANAMRQGHE